MPVYRYCTRMNRLPYSVQLVYVPDTYRTRGASPRTRTRTGATALCLDRYSYRYSYVRYRQYRYISTHKATESILLCSVLVSLLSAQYVQVLVLYVSLTCTSTRVQSTGRKEETTQGSINQGSTRLSEFLQSITLKKVHPENSFCIGPDVRTVHWHFCTVQVYSMYRYVHTYGKSRRIESDASILSPSQEQMSK